MNIRNYMSHFQCLGSECVDHCCGSWTVPIFEADFARLQQTLEPKELERLVEKKGSYRFRQTAGSCMAQCEGGLCSLQQRFGHAFLPSVCASYPRFLGRWKAEEELGGFLSCPEIARLSLLYSQELSVCQEPVRAHADVEITKQDTDYYNDFDVVRTAFFERLSEGSFNAALLDISYWATLSPAFFNRVTGSFAQLQERTQNLKNRPLATSNEDNVIVWDAFKSEIKRFLQREWPYRKPVKLLQAISVIDREELDAWAADNEGELQRLGRHYVIHDWNIRWYLHSPDLLRYWQVSLFKYYLLRLALFSLREQPWDDAFVVACYSLERLIEHTIWKEEIPQVYGKQPWPLPRWVAALRPPHMRTA